MIVAQQKYAVFRKSAVTGEWMIYGYRNNLRGAQVAYHEYVGNRTYEWAYGPIKQFLEILND